ncbi:GAF domain-containing sensor histidine kinase [Cytobacillus spongiae]|uniref:GAF domain-containing sensor histidine kinase n=1 Tax=Cytobacillus spongiae TaxID=2901381 RepID=UPI001F3820F9|nr:GAF domain-containing sensor histidine kinase [Cytobacillus spongiae]UII56769.1 GAF domain-containing sensor histidine kinase [Cytobacillus spongiae]
MKGERLSEIQILKEIAELLNEGTDLHHMLSEVLRKLLHVTGMKTGWIFLIDDSLKFRLAAYEALPPALRENSCEVMCEGDCWCIDRYNDGRLEKATNIIECKRIEDVIAESRGETNHLTHHATVPLRAGKEKFGLLNIGSPFKTHFSTEELDLLEAVAFQVGTAIKRINLTQREQENALTAERNRLARDLHDSVNQLLFSVSLTARGGKEMVADLEVKETFDYIQDLAQDALSEMRALIWQLRPKGLENGISSALKGYGAMLGLNVSTDVMGVICLPCKVEETLWRIGQEALANCKKHSQQTNVSIQFKIVNNTLVFTIKDQGCGFHYDDQQELPSLGLRSMKDRTELLNGQFDLESAPGKGTKIQITIPV